MNILVYGLLIFLVAFSWSNVSAFHVSLFLPISLRAQQESERLDLIKFSTLFPRCKYPLTTSREGIIYNYLSTPNKVLHSKISCGSADSGSSNCLQNKCVDYLNALRPVTIIQAVGALIVGYLTLSSGTGSGKIKAAGIVSASLSVYISYGCGMLMNDLVDVDTDLLHSDKLNRAIASGRISKKAGWIYCSILSSVSLLISKIFVGNFFTCWLAGNLGIMLLYAFGLQRVFLLKNIVCGWLAISPLVGASLLEMNPIGSKLFAVNGYQKLWSLAAVGFPIQVSREILKDIEDVDVDKGKKLTLPIVIGGRSSHMIAYAIVALNFSAIAFTPVYWKLFAHKIPIFPIGVAVSSIICAKAATMPLIEGQRLLKKSIYVLLAAMIGALSFQ